MTTQVNVGTYNMDTTGTVLYDACNQWNTNFSSLYSGTGQQPSYITVGTKNSSQGDSAYTIFSKANSNFAYLFTYYSVLTLPYVINVGSGPYNGVIGPGDTGAAACIKMNKNFALLGL